MTAICVFMRKPASIRHGKQNKKGHPDRGVLLLCFGAMNYFFLLYRQRFQMRAVVEINRIATAMMPAIAAVCIP